MFRLIEFIRSIYVVLLFVIAEAVAIGHYAVSDSYTRGRILVVTSSVTGGLHGAFRSTTHLFKLPRENRELTERIALLEAKIDLFEQAQEEAEVEQEVEIFSDPTYRYVTAKVISNSINKRDNFIVLNKGIEDNIYENMAVVTPSGKMLGYIVGCSDHYSVALSVLSHSFTTSGKVKDGRNFGSIRWSGEDRYRTSMHELSKYELFEVGDTIVSTGFSQIFPGGVTIGTVASKELNEMKTAYDVEIDLAVDVTSINQVLIVGHRDTGEIEGALESVGNRYN